MSRSLVKNVKDVTGARRGPVLRLAQGWWPPQSGRLARRGARWASGCQAVAPEFPGEACEGRRVMRRPKYPVCECRQGSGADPGPGSWPPGPVMAGTPEWQAQLAPTIANAPPAARKSIPPRPVVLSTAPAGLSGLRLTSTGEPIEYRPTIASAKQGRGHGVSRSHRSEVGPPLTARERSKLTGRSCRISSVRPTSDAAERSRRITLPAIQGRGLMSQEMASMHCLRSAPRVGRNAIADKPYVLRGAIRCSLRIVCS